MNNRIKTVAPWAAAVCLIVAAFYAGSALRASQSALSPVDSVQTTALLKLTPEWTPVPLAEVPATTNENRKLVGTVLSYLKQHFVEPIDREKETSMARGAVSGMLDSLNDPDSRFLDPAERQLLDDVGNGKFHGIGAVLALQEETQDELEVTKLVIVAPMPDSPAEKAGFLPGDSITHVDGKWVITHDPFKEAQLDKLAKRVRNREIDEVTYQKTYETAFKKLKDGITIKDALQSLTSKSSGEIAVKISRGENYTLEAKLNCTNTQVDPVIASLTKEGVAHIQILQFSKRAAKEFESELKRMQSGQAKALILDLRGNPGGLMDCASDVVTKVAGGGVIANIEQKNGKRIIRTARTPGLKIPVVVLVNRGTASVAELTAGALRENGGAVLVGTPTYGDGLVQTPLMLKDGSAAVLTTGKMLTPKGYDFNKKGITPDTVVDSPEAQLGAAMKVALSRIGEA